MTGWRLEPAGIEGVLTRAGEGRKTLAGVFTQAAADEVGEGLSWSPQLCGDVIRAVSELVGAGFSDFLAVLQTVDAGTAGVYNAAVAYGRAGAEMAGQFEAAAVRAATEGDFSFFEKNGYYQ